MLAISPTGQSYWHRNVWQDPAQLLELLQEHHYSEHLNDRISVHREVPWSESQTTATAHLLPGLDEKRRGMKYKILVILGIFLSTAAARAQGDPKDIHSHSEPAASITGSRDFPATAISAEKDSETLDPQSAESWINWAEQIRQHLLKEVIFHGWPQEWVNSQPNLWTWAVFHLGQDIKCTSFGMR